VEETCENPWVGLMLAGIHRYLAGQAPPGGGRRAARPRLRTLRRLSWRTVFADETIPSLAGHLISIIQLATGVFPRRLAQEEARCSRRRAAHNEDILNLGAYFASLTPPNAVSPTTARNLSAKGKHAAVRPSCASCHTDLRRHQGCRRIAGPARGISGEACTTKTGVRLLRRQARWPRRLSPKRRGNHRARAIIWRIYDSVAPAPEPGPP